MIVPAERPEQRAVAVLHGRVEAEDVMGLDEGAGRADQRRADACGMRPAADDEPAPGPPTNVHRRARCYAHPAEDGAVGGGGDEDGGPRIVVDVVVIGPGEQALSFDELRVAQAVIRVELGTGFRDPDEERRSGSTGCAGEDGQAARVGCGRRRGGCRRGAGEAVEHVRPPRSAGCCRHRMRRSPLVDRCRPSRSGADGRRPRG